MPCWITWTGDELRDTVREHLQSSALYGGEISGRGPRYCPSIEDKIVKFPDAARHQVFLEPEGLETTELYVNGLSTSLPGDVQLRMLRSVSGLENVRMTKLGYAIEYDYYPPHQLRPTLECKALDGLFLAGQVNGTTGYEEAAGQGLLAGANAAFAALDREPLLLERDQAFVGVLVDDLVTKGTDEPYRLFTSRAEFRLTLRQDNALQRLGTLAAERGMLTEGQRATLESRLRLTEEMDRWLRTTNATPEQAEPVLQAAGPPPLREPTRLSVLVKRPNVAAAALLEAVGGAPEGAPHLLEEVLTTAEMELRYEGYLLKERARAETLRRQADFPLPEALPYPQLESLSYEARQKLDRIRPATLAQAGRIPGVSPSDLQNLVMEVRKRRDLLAAAIVE